MQETHLKKREVIDFLSTLLSFKPLDTELILFKDSRTETNTFSVRYHQLKEQGLIDGVYSFRQSKEPKGTIIIRTK